MCRRCETTSVSSAAPSTSAEVDTLACRLPSNVRPSHYDLALAPNFETLRFDGHVTISITVLEETSCISLNAVELDFVTEESSQLPLVFVEPVAALSTSSSSAVSSAPSSSTSSRVQAQSIEADLKEERALLHFAQPLAKGSYVLSINFIGTLNENLCGFYHSSYKRADGSTSHMAVSQMEATDLRRALPSWDEPAVKATFAVTLIVPPTHQAVSNMPAVSFARTKAGESALLTRGLRFPVGSHRFVFATTPKMSTYLLALFVGEMDYISQFTSRGIEIRVWAPVGKAELGRFSLDVSIRALDYYENLFGIHFPLPKLDVLAIPDFSAGAMENWGAISYRETALLIDPKLSSTAVKQRVALTVSHEIAHTWFGNLVTMEWWTQLYLNEGFARFTEHLAVDHLFPEWKTWDDFVTKAVGQALSLDALESSHPIEIPVTHPNQINEIFDSISYAKGASVIRMLAYHIGVDKFFDGLRIYLKKHAYGNAVSNDLWKALSDVSAVDVSSMINTWIFEIGYPVVQIEELEATAEGIRRLRVTQSRFLASGKPDDRPERVWCIPMSIAVLEGGQVKGKLTHIFNSQESVIDIPASASAALKFNYEQTGFYRCQYSAPLLATLCQGLTSMSPVDRLGLQRDAFALAMSGRVPMTQAMDVIEQLSRAHESNLAVVQAYSASISYLSSVHSDEEYYPQLQRWIATVYAPALASLGWDAQPNEEGLLALHRGIVISQLGAASHEAVVAEAKRRLAAYVQDPLAHPISGDIRGAVYGIVARNGGMAERNTLLKLYRGTDSAEERTRILGVIGGVSDSSADRDACIDANIEWAFDSQEVRLADLSYVTSGLARNKHGRDRLWQYLVSNWDKVMARLMKGQNFILSDLLSGVLGQYKTLEAADEFEAFLKTHPVPSAERALAQTSESVRLTARRLMRDRSLLSQWLQQRDANSSS